MTAVGPSATFPSLSDRDRGILLGFASRIEPGDAGGHNNLGVLYFNKGLIEEAVDQFHLALEVDPTMPVALRNVEIAYLSTGFYDRLAADLEERLRANPGDRDARWRLARAHRHTGRVADARAELRQLLASSPDDARVLVELGRAGKDAGEFEEARGAYERAMQLDPDSAVLHFHLGELHYHQGRSEEARRVLAKAIELAPEFAEAHHLLSFVLGDLGESDRATESLARAREIAPWLGEARTGLSIDRHSAVRYAELMGDRRARPEALKDRFLAHYHLGIAFRQKGLYEEALRAFGRALERGEDRRLVRQAQAEVLLVAGRDAEAAALYRSLIEEQGPSAKLLNELGVCHHRMGDVGKAEECYEEATRQDLGYPLSKNNLGVARANRGDRAGARAMLNAAIAGGARLPETHCNIGILALEDGRRREALAAFRSAVEIDPHSAAGWLGIGAILSESDELREARRALARAVELAPESAEARYRLAFLLNRMGDVEGSLRETQRALALNPYFATPRLRLAIELQFEYAEVLAPELSTETRLDDSDELADFKVSPGELSAIFAGLRSPAEGRIEVAGAGFGLARDLLSKGLMARAMAEVKRVAAAGGDPTEAAVLSGEIFRMQGLHGEALDRFDDAIERMGTDRWTARHEEAHLGRGWASIALGRPELALESATAVEEHGGDRVEAGRLRSEAHLAMGRADPALDGFTELMEMNPRDPGLLMRIGAAARLAGRPELARQALVNALEIDPDRIAARVELGALYLADGLVDEAIEQGWAAFEALPGYADAALLIADAEMERSNAGAAVEILADLLADDPYNLDALVRLGESLLATGRESDAIFAFRRVLRFDPEMALGWRRLGEAYMAAGSIDDAAACWRRAIEVGIDEESAGILTDEIDRHEAAGFLIRGLA